ncbi:MAG: hypothetical protein JRN29_03010 [Nitrososphaerota archaeon]|nr:hypothetical protein [Nitrososphaerota archaeon]
MRLSTVLGVASSLLLLAGVLSAVLPLASAARLSVSPPGSYSVSGCCSVDFPVTVTNGGFLPVDGLTLTLTGTGRYSGVVLSGNASAQTVAPGSSSTLDVSIAMQNDSYFVTHNDTFLVTARVAAVLGGVLPADASTSFTIQWNPPVEGLDVGSPSLVSLSPMKLSVPFSFTDASGYVPVVGNLTVRAFNGTTYIGGGSASLDVSPGAPFSGAVMIALTGLDPQLLLNTSVTVSYDVYFSGQGFGARVYSSTYMWEAPFTNISVGQPTNSPAGSQVNVTVPASFYDSSSFSFPLEMNATLQAGGQEYSSGAVHLTPLPGQNTVYFSFLVPAASSPTSVTVYVTAYGASARYVYAL